jgi:hypothetical protein
VSIDTKQVRRGLSGPRFGHGADVEGHLADLAGDLCDEIDRLRGHIESSLNTCSRFGGCIPRDVL